MSASLTPDPARPSRWWYGLAAIWTAVVAALFAFGTVDHDATVVRLAQEQATIALQRDLLFRRWASMHGGVYVPVTARTPPNPYLEVPERDIVTPSGRRLTLMNPAYMIRQVHELAAETEGLRAHITSLDPIRPGNAPDAWERQAMKRMERGEETVRELVDADGVEHLRVMRPLYTEATCLKCHEKQGYKLGDLRGGLSVLVPMANYRAVEAKHVFSETVLYATVWMFGLVGVVLGRRVAAQRRGERDLLEATLREKEAHFRQLFEQAPVAYQSVDEAGRLVEVNQAWCGLLGYSREEVLGRPLGDFVHPDDHAVVAACIEALRSGCPESAADLRLRHRDGHELLVATTGRRIGDLARTHCVLHDLTAQRQALARVHESEVRYRTLFESATVGVALADFDTGLLVDANRSFCELVGWEREALIGQHQHVFHEDPPDPQGYSPEFASHRQHPGRIIATRIRTRAGEPKDVEIHAREVEVGGRRLMQAFFRDVTAERRAQARVAEQAALLDVTQDAIALHDPDGRVRYANRGFERLLGWTAADLEAERPGWGVYGPPGPRETALERVLAEGAWTGELRFTTRDAVEMVVLARWTLVRDEQGRPASVLALASDITEQRRLESLLLRAQRLESLGVLAGGVAHDLNNVLSPILMATPALREAVHAMEDRDLVDTVESCARRGASVVRQILTFARGIAGERGPIQPKHAIREIESILRETFPKSISLTVRAPSDLWCITGDTTQVQQLLMNLCVNARDAMPTGGELHVEARNVTFELPDETTLPPLAAGAYVELRVTDTGTGIPPDVLQRIFEPFFTTKPLGVGTGLGLSTALGIVRSHGGGIHVETRAGEGTSFHVYLPAQPMSAPSPAPLEHNSGIRGEGVTVLVVEDEASIRRLVESGLRRRGYEVVSTVNGHEALEAWRARGGRIDVVLTDLSMPVLDGPAFIRALRAESATVPVLLMSGLGETLSAEDIRGLGATDLLVKPFTVGELAAMLRGILSRERRDGLLD